jgi:hypothetical protein
MKINQIPKIENTIFEIHLIQAFLTQQVLKSEPSVPTGMVSHKF